MVDWVKSRLDRRDFKLICEDLLDELVSKDSGNQYGMDNMSAILIRFGKKWSHTSNTLQVFLC
jgi:hypothetical protein